MNFNSKDVSSVISIKLFKKKKCSHSILDLISIIFDIIYYNTKCNISKARNYLMQ